MINPGLAPWAMQEYRPKGLFYDKSKINVSACACCSECAYSIDTIALCVVLAALLSVFRLIMSAVGTTLLHSPGWNEGKARNETLGIYR